MTFSYLDGLFVVRSFLTVVLLGLMAEEDHRSGLISASLFDAAWMMGVLLLVLTFDFPFMFWGIIGYGVVALLLIALFKAGAIYRGDVFMVSSTALLMPYFLNGVPLALAAFLFGGWLSVVFAKLMGKGKQRFGPYYLVGFLIAFTLYFYRFV